MCCYKLVYYPSAKSATGIEKGYSIFVKSCLHSVNAINITLVQYEELRIIIKMNSTWAYSEVVRYRKVFQDNFFYLQIKF